MAKVESADLDVGGSAVGRWGLRALQLILGLVTPLALISLGGLAIYAGAGLLPLLWIAARSGRSFVRWYLTVLGGLVGGEVLWAVAWVFFPDVQFLGALLGIAVTMGLFALSFRSQLGASTVFVIAFALMALGASGALALVANPGTQRAQTTFDSPER